MRSKVKVTMMALVTVAASNAIGAASASANWFIGGTELKTSAALSTAATVTQHLQLSTPNISLTLLCSSLKMDVKETEVFFDLWKSREWNILECNTAKPATGCALAVSNQTISTSGLNGRPFLGPGGEDRILFSAQTKATLAEIEFNEANTCVFNGREPLKGAVTFGMPTGQTEAIAQALVGLGSVENNSLELGSGNKTFINGEVLFTLASGSKWSFK